MCCFAESRRVVEKLGVYSLSGLSGVVISKVTILVSPIRGHNPAYNYP